jgi:hypothetical protein
VYSLARDKHSSLLARSVIDEENRFMLLPSDRYLPVPRRRRNVVVDVDGSARAHHPPAGTSAEKLLLHRLSTRLASGETFSASPLTFVRGLCHKTHYGRNLRFP